MKKKLFALLLIFTMVFGAAMSAHAGKMQNFPVQNINGYSVPYTRALQIMLINYSSATRAKIVNSGGIDGSFGYATRDAVKLFQANKGLSQDGSCGPITWQALRNMLQNVGSENTSEYHMAYYYAGPYRYQNTYCMILSERTPLIGSARTYLWTAFYNGKRYTVETEYS